MKKLSNYMLVLTVLAYISSDEYETGVWIHDPSEIHLENDHYMVFSTGEGIQSWYRHKDSTVWRSAGVIEKPRWWDEVFPDNEGQFWAPCVPGKRAGRWYRTGTSLPVFREADTGIRNSNLCQERIPCSAGIPASVLPSERGSPPGPVRDNR